MSWWRGRRHDVPLAGGSRRTSGDTNAMLRSAIRAAAAVLHDRAGVSAMEYAAMGVGIVVAVVAAIAAIGTDAAAMLNSVGSGV